MARAVFGGARAAQAPSCTAGITGGGSWMAAEREERAGGTEGARGSSVEGSGGPAGAGGTGRPTGGANPPGGRGISQISHCRSSWRFWRPSCWLQRRRRPSEAWCVRRAVTLALGFLETKGPRHIVWRGGGGVLGALHVRDKTLNLLRLH